MGHMKTAVAVLLVLALIAIALVQTSTADELTDLSSADPLRHSGDSLGEDAATKMGTGVGWGGAVATSGELEVSASTSAEEELGEGVGWGGAVATSGEFEVSASTSA